MGRGGESILQVVFKILMVVDVVYCKILYEKNNKIEAVFHNGVTLKLKAEFGCIPDPS